MWEDVPLAPAPADADVDEWASACAAVRGEAGWHVAPTYTETVVVRGALGGSIMLPTLYLREVVSITDQDGVTYGPAGLIVDRNGWVHAGRLPSTGVFTVVFKHGFDTCPDDLLRVVRARLQSLPAGGQFQAGPFSFSPGSGDEATEMARTMARYTLPERP